MGIALIGSIDLCYPHLFDLIIHYTSHEGRLALRATSKRVCERVDALYFPKHVLVGFDDKGVTVSSASPDDPSHVRRLFYTAAGLAAFGASKEVKHLLCWTHILDLDSLVDMHWGHLEAILTSMPSLETVRFCRPLSLGEPTLPIPLSVIFTRGLEDWDWEKENHLFLEVASGIDKIVINLSGNDAAHVPKLDKLDEWVWGYTEYDDDGRLLKVYAGNEMDLSEDVHDLLQTSWSSPKEVVFCVSYFGASKDTFTFTTTLARYLVFHLLKHLWWVKPIFVVFAEVEPDTDNTPTQAERTTEKEGETMEEKKAWSDAELRRRISTLKDDIAAIICDLEHPSPIKGYSPVWPKDRIEAMISRLEVLTAKEYRDRVGDDDFVLETRL